MNKDRMGSLGRLGTDGGVSGWRLMWDFDVERDEGYKT